MDSAATTPKSALQSDIWFDAAQTLQYIDDNATDSFPCVNCATGPQPSALYQFIAAASTFVSRCQNQRLVSVACQTVVNGAANRLPMEIVLQLTSFLDGEDKTQLYSCMAVNRSWSLAAVRKLWKTVSITSDSKWKYFEQTLLNERYSSLYMYSKYIRRLELANLKERIPLEHWIALISTCNMLETLSLNSVLLESAPAFDYTALRQHYLKSTVANPFKLASSKYATSKLSGIRLENMEPYLPILTSLEISWSPDLTLSTLLLLIYNAPQVSKLTLSGIHTLTEQDFCALLPFVPNLTELKLGDARSTRAAFASTRSLGVFNGQILATELTHHCKNLTSIELNGLMKLDSDALMKLLTVSNPISVSNVENEVQDTVNVVMDANAVDIVPGVIIEDNAPDIVEPAAVSRNVRLNRISLDSSTSHMEDILLNRIFTSEAVISNLTYFSLSESHSLSDATFVAIIKSMRKTLSTLNIGPGLNLSEVALLSVGQFCEGLRHLSVNGMFKCRDVGVLVENSLPQLESLVICDMKNLTETRSLVVAPRKKSAWRAIIENIVREEEGVCFDFERQMENAPHDQIEEAFVDALQEFDQDFNGMQDFGGQVNADEIAAEILAASTGLVIPNPEDPAVIGCLAIRRIEFINCPNLGGSSIVKIVSGMNSTLKSVVVTGSNMDDDSRLDMIEVFPGVDYA